MVNWKNFHKNFLQRKKAQIYNVFRCSFQSVTAFWFEDSALQPFTVPDLLHERCMKVFYRFMTVSELVQSKHTLIGGNFVEEKFRNNYSSQFESDDHKCWSGLSGIGHKASRPEISQSDSFFQKCSPFWSQFLQIDFDDKFLF